MQDFSGEIAALTKRLGEAEVYLRIADLRERRHLGPFQLLQPLLKALNRKVALTVKLLF